MSEIHNTEEDQDEELVAVEDEQLQQQQEEPPKDDEDEDHDDDLDDEEEARAGHAEGEDDEREKIRERRRAERKRKRERAKEDADRKEREINYLRSDNQRMDRELQDLKRRVGASETSQIDGRINTLKAQIKSADTVMARAMDAGKSEDFIEAQGIRDTFRDQLRELESLKERFEGGDSGAPDEEPPPDPLLVQHATNFMSKHSWYDPAGGDEDSLIVTAIDNALAREAYDPRTRDYWDELERRVKARLPHQFEDNPGGGNGKVEDDNRKGRGEKRQSRGPTFRTGGQERPLKPNEVYISPERKEAMMEAGVWDDPELRQKYLKQYADWDRENAGTGA